MDAPSPMAELQDKHRKEQKDLQARITQKKKSATKKTRKGVNSECEDLEMQMKERHQQEIAALDGSGTPALDDVPDLEDDVPDSKDPRDISNDAVSGIAEQLQSSNIDGNSPAQDQQPKKRNRQKERLARRAAEQEEATMAAEKEAAKLPNWKRMERTSMEKAFKQHGLVEKEIQPDGHCLFSAVADQLSYAGIPLSTGTEDEAEIKSGMRYKVMRKAAAKYIEDHPDDFEPFLEEPLFTYVHKIRDTAEWGGQLELLALAKTYHVEIRVLQTDGRVEKIEPGEGEAKDVETIWVGYYRHGYGLGEHYNSLRKSP
jgi:OTU domain-containing protein 6